MARKKNCFRNKVFMEFYILIINSLQWSNRKVNKRRNPVFFCNFENKNRSKFYKYSVLSLYNQKLRICLCNNFSPLFTKIIWWANQGICFLLKDNFLLSFSYSYSFRNINTISIICELEYFAHSELFFLFFFHKWAWLEMKFASEVKQCL